MKKPILVKFIFIFISLLISGCATPPLKNQPQHVMQHFKYYRRVEVYASNSYGSSTDIIVQKNDMMIFMASGSVVLNTKNKYYTDRAPRGCLFYSINGMDQGNTVFRWNIGIHEAKNSGRLSFTIFVGSIPGKGPYYEDNSGSFTIDIFVFEKNKEGDVPKLLSELAHINPEDQIFKTRANEVVNEFQMILAERKTKQEISETQEEVNKITENMKSNDKAQIAAANDDLEIMKARLAQLTEQLKKFEDIKKDYEVQKQREMDLLAKLDEEKKKQQTMLQRTQQDENKLREQELLAIKEDQKVREKELRLKYEAEQKLREQELMNQLRAEQKQQEIVLLAQLDKARQRPPIVFIGSPQNDIEVETHRIILSGAVEDDQAIERVDFYINGELIGPVSERGILVSNPKKQTRFDFHERIELNKGKNTIQIKAIDSDDLETIKECVVNYRATRKNLWAVVIGIDNYKNIRNLKYASKDANAFYNHLVKSFNIFEQNVTLLLNEKAHLDNIRSTLGTYLKRKAGKDDMVLIYFAGHGATEEDATSPDGDGLEKYILPYDADLKDLYTTSIPMSEVAKIFSRIQSDRLIFIADACYSGASGGRTIGITGMRANISEAFMDRIASGKGRVIITASGANEVSTEKDDFQHGVFTYYLLEGLKGKADFDKDGIVTVDEAYNYVSINVPLATGQAQHPVRKGTVEGQLIMGILE